jgi:enoyl-CoA hydratase/carnithine racemase
MNPSLEVEVYENFAVERTGRIATVTLNRPEKRNPINEAMLGEFETILARLRDDVETRVVILTGAGPSFCAGADLSVVEGVSDPVERQRVFAESRSRRIRLISRTFGMLEQLEQPTIAAVNGPAVGGGWGLALACDFQLAVPGARFWFPEVDLGVPLSMASTARLFGMVGTARAKRIILTCSRHSAEELEAWGMIHRVVPPESLLGACRELAEQLVDKAPRALTTSKLHVNILAAVAAHEGGVYDPDVFIHRPR